jgi:hypothetical protein
MAKPDSSTKYKLAEYNYPSGTYKWAVFKSIPKKYILSVQTYVMICCSENIDPKKSRRHAIWEHDRGYELNDNNPDVKNITKEEAFIKLL